MPYARPTLTQIRALVAADIASAIPGADALLRFSNLKVIGDVQADAAHNQYGYLDWISKQSNPFTSTDEFLQGWGALKKVFLKDAQAATGQITYNGTPGTLLPSGYEIIRGDGVTYTTQADGTIGGGGTVTVTALAAVAAAAGNADIGTIMTLGQAISGIQSNGAVSAAFTGGADVETQDAFRSRVLQAYASPPQGGDVTDYVEWALAVAGVTRAWCSPNGNGIGTVIVYTMFDVSEAAHGGFPQGADGVATSETRDTAATGDQLAVANYIFPIRPVTALVYSFAPTPNTINFTISEISGVSSAVKAAISSAIAGVFLMKGAPGNAVDVSGSPYPPVDLSDIESAIADIAGTEGFIITAPSSNITSGAGQLPVLGTVTYT